MRLKFIFTKPDEAVPVNNQKELNSFIHRSLKHNNLHDAFSFYNISSLQGGKYNNGFLTFSENPYIYISANTDTKQGEDFMNLVLEKFLSSTEKLFGMSIKNFVLEDFKVNKNFDKITTISPILLREKTGDRQDKKITFEDSEWLDVLNKQCINKLKHCGIEDETFRIEYKNPDNKGKYKTVWVGDSFNPVTMTSLIVYGKEKTRLTLYNLGLGNSTGSGFGSIKVYNYN